MWINEMDIDEPIDDHFDDIYNDMDSGDISNEPVKDFTCFGENFTQKKPKKSKDKPIDTNENLNEDEKIKIIDKILEMYPQLKKDRKTIIDKIIPPKRNKYEECILERVTINESYYYRDKYYSLLDADANLIGVWDHDGTKYIYYFHDNTYKQKINEGIQIKLET